MNDKDILAELRFIRGLLIHIALLIATVGLFLIMKDFKITDFIFVVLLGIQSLGVTGISLKANFGRRT